ncbi:MAG: class I SAM-dependent DNA methyltransferase [Candidatus Poribacteria bacterium]|nr:class I SAM-dependent DNA methyltransferase [Candidatus Poribacteria bacterium]
MAIKKSQLYASLWQSCDELRGGMDSSQYKEYILTLLFMKYVSDKAERDPYALIRVPENGSFSDMIGLIGNPNIGEEINVIIGNFAEANDLNGVIDLADFDDSSKLGRGKEKQDRLSALVAIFNDLNLTANRAEGDDLLGDAYEYLMRHFATESGKSKGQFYTPAEVSRIMAKVIGIGRDTKQDETIYDPACGSGSLLLRASDEAPRGLSIYGQEKDNATHALARMNMILHDNATADLRHGNTLSAPEFTAEGRLRTFDFAVANPPFSDKAWTNGLNPAHDEFRRFEYGVPPAKNGDYAFLLHFIASLKSRGKGAIILPHGVLFRGNREAVIRTEIVRRGYIKGIIGLPANLFYGTGIPACILVIAKENARVRTGIFMIDASSGFLKDGNKNRLRAQDMHKIVSIFNEQTELPGYSRIVSISEIANPANDYNLNIPRYIDASVPVDLHNLDAHLNGGIPDADIDALNKYWTVFPTLRNALFKNNERPGYNDSLVENQQIKTTIIAHAEFTSYHQRVDAVFQAWREEHEDFMLSIGIDSVPRKIIHTLSEDLLMRFANLPLLDSYDVYQRLMDYWDEVMQDDVYLIASEGWLAGRILRLANDKETLDFTIKKGQKTFKFVGELIPASLVISTFFDNEKRKLEHLKADLEVLEHIKEEFEEEHGEDEGALVGLEGSKGSITIGNVEQRVKEHQKNLLKVYPEETPEYARVKSVKKKDLSNREWIENIRRENNLFEKLDSSYADEVEGIILELDVLYGYLELIRNEARQKMTYKQTLDRLYTSVIAKYTKLTETEIKTLVVKDKWFSSIQAAVESETERIAQEFAGRVKELEERYATPLPELTHEVMAYSARVEKHLRMMSIE